MRIADIRLSGGKTLTKDTVLYYLEVRPGDPFDEAAVRRGFRRLWDSGLVSDLRIDSETGEKGLVLVVTVVERTRITTVEFEGNRKVSNSQIRDKLKEVKAEIKDGSPFSQGVANRLQAAIVELYESLGYKAANVVWRLEEPDRVETKLLVEIDEGDKTKIDEILFTGNTVFPHYWLAWNMSKLTTTAWWKFWTDADVFNRAAYDEDAATLRALYQEKGYKDIQIGEPILESFNVDTTPFWSSKTKIERRLRLTIPIIEGEQFTFGKIRIEGAKLFSEEMLLALFDCPPGDVLKRSRFDEGLTALEEIYRSRGYIYVYGNPDFADQPDRSVDIRVKVTEGDQFELGRVEFVGNSSTRDKVLRRELRIAEGDTMNMEAFKTSLYKINQLGFFKLAEDPVEILPNPETKKVNITVKGEEVGRNDVQFAGGYSEIDGFFGQFQFNTRNFLGNGESIGLSYQSGASRSFFEIGYTNPWFLDRRNVIGMSIFSRTQNYYDADQESKGGSILYGVGLRDFENVSLFYNWEKVNSTFTTLNPSDDEGGGGGGEGGDDGQSAFLDLADEGGIDDGPAIEYVEGVTSSITPGYRYDSRNDPFDPSAGMRFSFATEIAGSFFGGTNKFIKPEVKFTLYKPMARKLTFALNSEGGWIVPYGGLEIPLFERYRLGGERTIRGFGYGTIVPRRDNGFYYYTNRGSRLGGAKYLLFNLEAIFAVAGPLKFVLFTDAGNTWMEGNAASLSDLRHSAGGEVRIFIPIFQAPLRFIYGINLDPLPGEPKTDFQFTIGTNF